MSIKVEWGGAVLAGVELDGVATDPANECGRDAYWLSLLDVPKSAAMMIHMSLLVSGDS